MRTLGERVAAERRLESSNLSLSVFEIRGFSRRFLNCVNTVGGTPPSIEKGKGGEIPISPFDFPDKGKSNGY